MGASVDDVFRAIADKTRRDILISLSAGEQTVTQICASFPISQPSVSAHLQLLRNIGLVRVQPKANERLYSLDPHPLLEVAQWIDYFRSFWDTKLDDLGMALGDTHAAEGSTGSKRSARKRRSDHA